MEVNTKAPCEHHYEKLGEPQILKFHEVHADYYKIHALFYCRKCLQLAVINKKINIEG